MANMECDFCGEQMETLEYNCERCGNIYCTQHRLPESHDCIGLKLGKAERALKREEKGTVPWFKDEFRLSNVEKEQSRRVSTGSQVDDSIAAEDKYRSSNATEECAKCGTSLFEYEAAGCPHCEEIYCGDHLAEHRRNCSEPKTRLDEIEEERSRRYSSPDVNLDGSLSEPEYEDDIQSIGGKDVSNAQTTRGLTGETIALAIMMLVVAVVVIILFASL